MQPFSAGRCGSNPFVVVRQDFDQLQLASAFADDRRGRRRVKRYSGHNSAGQQCNRRALVGLKRRCLQSQLGKTLHRLPTWLNLHRQSYVCARCRFKLKAQQPVPVGKLRTQARHQNAVARLSLRKSLPVQLHAARHHFRVRWQHHGRDHRLAGDRCG